MSIPSLTFFGLADSSKVRIRIPRSADRLNLLGRRRDAHGEEVFHMATPWAASGRYNREIGRHDSTGDPLPLRQNDLWGLAFTDWDRATQ